jgi:hypothetical protein
MEPLRRKERNEPAKRHTIDPGSSLAEAKPSRVVEMGQLFAFAEPSRTLRLGGSIVRCILEMP